MHYFRNKLIFYYIIISIIIISLSNSRIIFAQTIAEKKESLEKINADTDSLLLEPLKIINQELDEKKFFLQQLYAEALQLYNSKATPDCYKIILQQIKQC